MRVVVLIALAACGSSKSSSSAPPAEPLPASSPVASSSRDAWASESPPAAPATKPTAPAAKPTAPSAPSTPAPNQSSSVAEQWVNAHNRVRAKHCAPPLTWSPKLADVAQKWADTLKSKGCVFGHSPGGKYGENLAAGTSGALGPESATAMWYDEVAKYKFPKGGFSMETGHFTQVVWTTTRQVGCGVVSCKGNDIYVCNYDPPGNWQGQYASHVLPTSCKKGKE